jgi:hypothetical protein
MADDGASLMAAAIIAFNAVYFGYRWYRRNSLGARLSLRRVARSTIRDAVDGTVHLRGRVLGDDGSLEAPLSRRRCLFYDVLIEDVSRTPARPVLRQVRGLAFRLQDETGIARVVFGDVGPAPPLVAGPRDVECAIRRDVRQRKGWFDGAPPRIDALLAEHGLDHPGLVVPHRLKASEGVILAGDTVAVLGRGAREVTPAGDSSGYRAPPLEYIVKAAEGAPLTLVKISAMAAS